MDQQILLDLLLLFQLNGTVSSLSITNGGSGYVGATTSISISAPHSIGVGVGTTATATASITNGVITGTTITNLVLDILMLLFHKF